MKYSPKYAMQTSGEMRRWSNPDRTFHLGLVKLNFECEADPYPGVLILTDSSYKCPTAMSVSNLRKELPKILEPLGDDTVAYWRMVKDDAERSKVLTGLTVAPIFDDILG